MQKASKYFSWLLSLVILLNLIPMNVYATNADYAVRLKAGSGNGNEHFTQTGKPEAFVLTTEQKGRENFSFQFKLLSTREHTRLRLVTKYVSDTQWSYIAYDGKGPKWFFEYKNGSQSGWPDLRGLPTVNQNDEVRVTGTYTETELTIRVENLTAGTNGTATIQKSAQPNFFAVVEAQGKVGFGSGAWGTEYTEILLKDVRYGETSLTPEQHLSAFAPYKANAQGQIFERVVAPAAQPSTPPAQPSTPANPPATTGTADANNADVRLKSGAGNGNGHFTQTGTPEAFYLTNDTYGRDASFGVEFKLISPKAETRFRIVPKYVNDNAWTYIGYDGNGDNPWYLQYKNGNEESWPALNGLPLINQNDEVMVTGLYEADKLTLVVSNSTTSQEGQVEITRQQYPHFFAVADQQGKFGFGAAKYNEEYTEVHLQGFSVNDQDVPKAELLNKFSPYRQIQGQIFERVAPPVQETPATEENQSGKKWITVNSNTKMGGHSYSNASVNAPAVILNQSRTLAPESKIEALVKPSGNWAMFYTYENDNNWLYIGYDDYSKWYWQYKRAGTEEYRSFEGLPEPVAGQEMQMSLTLSRETLEVNVNGQVVHITDSDFIQVMGLIQSRGRFGFKSHEGELSFADFKYNDQNAMGDNWRLLAQRNGQNTRTYYVEVADVTGTIKDASQTPLADAVVRFGTHTARTNEQGQYTLHGLELREYAVSVSKRGYVPHSQNFTVSQTNKVLDANLSAKAELDLSNYDSIESDTMKVYIGRNFPLVARYVVKEGELVFLGNELPLNTLAVNGQELTPQVSIKETLANQRTYTLRVESGNVRFTMDVLIKVEGNHLTYQVTRLTKDSGSDKIASIDFKNLNLLTINGVLPGENFAGAVTSTDTTKTGDRFIDFENGFVPNQENVGFLYAFLNNTKLSAGLYSNSEIERDQRVVRNNGADTISLTSAPFYYEKGDVQGQQYLATHSNLEYPVSDLPLIRVALAKDLNQDNVVDWNDGAIAYRSIMNVPYGSEKIKDFVNYRIVMNFASMVSNPYMVTADNIKKVYLATDGLPQAVMLKGYGNEGHDSANSEYADIAEREGGVKDFRELIRIAHDYDTEIGIHINAQEAYQEAKSFHDDMLQKPYTNGWGWLDQSLVIDKHWDLASSARWKRLVQLYDEINNTNHYNRKWPLPVSNSLGEVVTPRESIREEALRLPHNMDFIYLDVWYQNSWETRKIAKEINDLGWRFSTEFSDKGEHDSTWQHWSTDAVYGGQRMKGFNSDIIRFIKNSVRDSQVLNHPEFGGTADNPLLGGYRLYGFEGWGGDRDYNQYIRETFNQNLPTKFLQHYDVVKWENYEGNTSPAQNHEKRITLKNAAGDRVVVERKSNRRADTNIERTITLNDRLILDETKYLLPWTEKDGTEKLYHWNLEGGTSTWSVTPEYNQVVVYELSDMGRINPVELTAQDGQLTLQAKAATAYVVVKQAGEKRLVNGFGEGSHTSDPGFNAYPEGSPLAPQHFQGDIQNPAVKVTKSFTGDQRLTFDSPVTDVEVTTLIRHLKPGTHYVATVYVENESTVDATLKVNAGSKEVSVTAGKSILQNYVKSDQKNGTKMQRMQVSFVAESDTAILKLGRKAGTGATYMDDVRIVEKQLNNFREDGSFVQDFETVVQGLYPFVLSAAQGISDPVTHLSQKHAPFTNKDWNGRVIDDVLDGEWSLKHHGRNTGIIYQTLPQNFKFEPGKVYQVEFDYQVGVGNAYAFVVGDGENFTMPTSYFALANTTQRHSFLVEGAASGLTWIGLYENGGAINANAGPWGQRDFILDNLVIRETTQTLTLALSKTEALIGEVLDYVSNSATVEWRTQPENSDLISIHPETKKITALRAGTVQLTARLADGTEKTFTLTIQDKVLTALPQADFSQATATANTAETTTNEPQLLGTAGAAFDGNLNTAWHSQWSGTRFNVTESTPARLTIDLGQNIALDGFDLVQRPSGANGIVKKVKYRILDANNQVLAEITNPHTVAKQGAGQSERFVFANTVPGARKIEIEVLQGEGRFASIAEIVPLKAQHVARTATLAPVEVPVGSYARAELVVPENHLLTGVEWSIENAELASINDQGVIQGKKAGVTKVRARNAVGLNVEAALTVTAVEEDGFTYTAPALPGQQDAPSVYSVTELPNHSLHVEYEAAMSASTPTRDVYDIYFKENNVRQPTVTGEFLVKLPRRLDSQVEGVVYLNAQGEEVEVLEWDIEGNFVVFTTTHFSLYAVQYATPRAVTPVQPPVSPVQPPVSPVQPPVSPVQPPVSPAQPDNKPVIVLPEFVQSVVNYVTTGSVKPQKDQVPNTHAGMAVASTGIFVSLFALAVTLANKKK